MIARADLHALRLAFVLTILVAACSTTTPPSPSAHASIPSPSAAGSTPATPTASASLEPSLDPNGLPPTTATGWWGDVDGETDCVTTGHYRIGYRVAQIGDCRGVVGAPPDLTLDVGEDFDLHMTIPAEGAPPTWPLPEPEDPLIVRGWLAFDAATWSYRALSPGTTRLASAAPCTAPSTETAGPTTSCPILVIHVRDIDTRCVELPDDVCRAVAAAAVTEWLLVPGQRIVGWVAEPDSFIGGTDCGDGVAKVTFSLRDPDVTFPVQVGRLEPSPSGRPRYVACTY